MLGEDKRARVAALVLLFCCISKQALAAGTSVPESVARVPVVAPPADATMTQPANNAPILLPKTGILEPVQVTAPVVAPTTVAPPALVQDSATIVAPPVTPAPAPATSPAVSTQNQQQVSKDVTKVAIPDNSDQAIFGLIEKEAKKPILEKKEEITIKRGRTNTVNLNQDKSGSSATAFSISASDKSAQPVKFDDLANRAYEAAQLGHMEAALALYQKALTIDPKSTTTMYAMATIYQKRGQLGKAEPLYKEVLRQRPEDHNALINYLSLLSATDSNKALKELLALEKINANFAPVIGQIGMIYAQQKRYDQAISYLQRASALEPDELYYLYNLAVTYDNKGEWRKARQLYYQVAEHSQFHNVKPPVSLDKIEARIKELT